MRYNDFLKQSLTKEMFVNELEGKEPKEILRQGNGFVYCANEDEINEFSDKWQEAEKKVIFEGVELSKINNQDLLITKSNGYRIEFGESTLYALSIETGGQLKLKNLEI